MFGVDLFAISVKQTHPAGDSHARDRGAGCTVDDYGSKRRVARIQIHVLLFCCHSVRHAAGRYSQRGQANDSALVSSAVAAVVCRRGFRLDPRRLPSRLRYA